MEKLAKYQRIWTNLGLFIFFNLNIKMQSADKIEDSLEEIKNLRLQYKQKVSSQ